MIWQRFERNNTKILTEPSNSLEHDPAFQSEDGKAKSKARSIVARYDDFGRLFDVIIAVKSKLDIQNGAVALRVMADLAMERLAEIERSDQAVS